jgi:hypothetical protein
MTPAIPDMQDPLLYHHLAAVLIQLPKRDDAVLEAVDEEDTDEPDSLTGLARE